MDRVIHQNTKLVVMIKALLISYVITALILVLLSFLMLKMDLPSVVISAGIYLTYIISIFVGGFFTGRKLEQKKFIWGLVLGVCYFVILILVSLGMNSISQLPLGSYLTVFLVCSMSGMLGGMIC